MRCRAGGLWLCLCLCLCASLTFFSPARPANFRYFHRLDRIGARAGLSAMGNVLRPHFGCGPSRSRPVTLTSVSAHDPRPTPEAPRPKLRCNLNLNLRHSPTLSRQFDSHLAGPDLCCPLPQRAGSLYHHPMRGPRP